MNVIIIIILSQVFCISMLQIIGFIVLIKPETTDLNVSKCLRAPEMLELSLVAYAGSPSSLFF